MEKIKEENGEQLRECRLFFRNILEEYVSGGKNSSLYRFFKNEYGKEVRQKIQEYQKKRKENEAAAREMLLLAPLAKEGTGSGRKLQRRSDFYEELLLNFYAYEKAHITDTEYYVWLVEYLDATTGSRKPHDKYYKDAKVDRIFRIGGRRTCEYLDLLLQRGLCLTAADWSGRIGEARHAGKQTERLLEELNGLLHGTEKEAVKERLHGIFVLRNGKKEDYLRILVQRLRMAALHFKIEEFFRDNGCAMYRELQKDEIRLRELKTEPEKSFSKEGGKKKYRMEPGFDIRLALSQTGYGQREDAFAGGTLYLPGYICYVASNEEAEALLGEIRDTMRDAMDEDCALFVPLVMDPISRCMLAIVGKENYAAMYEKQMERLHSGDWKCTKEQQKHFLEDYHLYKKRKEKCCIDILYLDMHRLCEFQEHSDASGGTGISHRLLPRFHRNAEKSYEEVLLEFQKYCEGGDGCKGLSYYEWARREREEQIKKMLPEENRLEEYLPSWLGQEELPYYWKGEGKPESPREAVRMMLCDPPEHVPRGLKEFFN